MLTDHAELSIAPLHIAPAPDSRLLAFDRDQALLAGDDGAPRIATYAQLAPALPEGAACLHLASADGVAVYCPDPLAPCAVPPPPGMAYRSVRSFQRMPQPEASLLTACYHLWCWYRRNRFCGRCGKPLAHAQNERALHCAACDNIVFPMIAPAVIVAVTRRGKLLLAQNLHYATRHHTLIAGYVEVGETIEGAVRREVMEEVGLRLDSVRYLGDQPWGLSGSLMFGFHAEASGDEPIRLQQDELASAAWYARDELPNDMGKGSIAYALIERFRTGTL